MGNSIKKTSKQNIKNILEKYFYKNKFVNNGILFEKGKQIDVVSFLELKTTLMNHDFTPDPTFAYLFEDYILLKSFSYMVLRKNPEMLFFEKVQYAKCIDEIQNFILQNPKDFSQTFFKIHKIEESQQQGSGYPMKKVFLSYVRNSITTESPIHIAFWLTDYAGHPDVFQSFYVGLFKREISCIHSNREPTTMIPIAETCLLLKD